MGDKKLIQTIPSLYAHNHGIREHSFRYMLFEAIPFISTVFEFIPLTEYQKTGKIPINNWRFPL